MPAPAITRAAARNALAAALEAASEAGLTVASFEITRTGVRVYTAPAAKPEGETSWKAEIDAALGAPA